MKKNYVKPSLFYEDFVLMDVIASCSSEGGMILQQASYTVCAAYNTEWEETWLLDITSACTDVKLTDYAQAQYGTAMS